MLSEHLKLSRFILVYTVQDLYRVDSPYSFKFWKSRPYLQINVAEVSQL